MTKEKKYKIIMGLITLVILITGFSIVIYWYSWKLAMGIFLIIWANNMART